MTALRMPTTVRPHHAGGDTKPPPAVHQGTPNGHLLANSHLLEGELLDLYVAIVIVVPLALFLKSLLI
jgi:hypothetical protein